MAAEMKKAVKPDSIKEIASKKSGLTNDGHERSNQNDIMIRNRNRDCSPFLFFLHDNVASALAHLDKSVTRKDFTDIAAG
jgi:hypothetical protein